jgi:hypothetical protein
MNFMEMLPGKLFPLKKSLAIIIVASSEAD